MTRLTRAEVVLEVGMVCKHHTGRIYTVIALANGEGTDPEKFPLTVVYMGANGNVWARESAVFSEKFTVLYDGTNYAPRKQ